MDSAQERWEARYGKAFKYDTSGPFAGAAGRQVEDQQVLDIYEAGTGALLFRGHWGNHVQARVAAAAPELLEALERAEQLLSGITDIRWDLAEFRDGIIRQSRAAISKARGEG